MNKRQAKLDALAFMISNAQCIEDAVAEGYDDPRDAQRVWDAYIHILQSMERRLARLTDAP